MTTKTASKKFTKPSEKLRKQARAGIAQRLDRMEADAPAGDDDASASEPEAAAPAKQKRPRAQG